MLCRDLQEHLASIMKCEHRNRSKRLWLVRLIHSKPVQISHERKPSGQIFGERVRHRFYRRFANVEPTKENLTEQFNNDSTDGAAGPFTDAIWHAVDHRAAKGGQIRRAP
jgi:hypothetical protein